MRDVRGSSSIYYYYPTHIKKGRRVRKKVDKYQGKGDVTPTPPNPELNVSALMRKLGAANSRAHHTTPNVRGGIVKCEHHKMKNIHKYTATNHFRSMAANPRLHQSAHAPKRKDGGIRSW